MSSLRIFNYEKQKESDKDLKFNLRLRLAAKINLPLKVDLRESKFIPAVLDQGNLGASTANACSNVLRYILHKEKNRDFQPSRLYMYWFSRFLEGKKDEDGDCNSTIRNTLTSIHTFGACDETLIPYNVNKFKMKPSNQCVRNATQNIKEFKYLSLEPSLLQIKQCLNGGFLLSLLWMSMNPLRVKSLQQQVWCVFQRQQSLSWEGMLWLCMGMMIQRSDSL